jgi:hypothetical protein
MNLFAAVQTATRLLKHEIILEILDIVWKKRAEEEAA